MSPSSVHADCEVKPETARVGVTWEVMPDTASDCVRMVVDNVVVVVEVVVLWGDGAMLGLVQRPTVVSTSDDPRCRSCCDQASFSSDDEEADVEAVRTEEGLCAVVGCLTTPSSSCSCCC